MKGRYEVRRETRKGVEVLAIYWCRADELPSLFAVVGDEDRLALLAEALNSHLQSPG